MDTSLIEAYAAAMTSQPQMTELEIIADGVHVRLRRNIAVVDAPHDVSSDEPEHAVEKYTHYQVTAQSVGVFVPTEPAFEVGDVVDGTRSLGDIDTVGITNSIVSSVTGVVAAVHVMSGQPVEYGQALFDLLESTSK
jgi:biotin carboxyl carrier protein